MECYLKEISKEEIMLPIVALIAIVVIILFIVFAMRRRKGRHLGDPKAGT